MAKKTRYFCVAVEGATTDGREISRDWIDQMAASYDPPTYRARVNMEHLRGYSPEPPFNAYGDVLAVEARDVEIQLNGKTEKRRALFAQIDPTDQLVEINGKRQKLFTSIEVNPNFAGTGKAYLMGLAVTDSPASLGTEMLQFAAGAGAANPLAARKQQPGNLFTAAGEHTLDLTLEPEAEPEATPADPAKPSLLAAVFAALGAPIPAAFGGAGAPAAPVAPAAPAPVAAPVAAPAADQSAGFTAGLAVLATALEKSEERTAKAFADFGRQLGELRTSLETESDPDQDRRPPSTGGGSYTRTDC